MRINSETIKARTYPLMREAVESGTAYGWQRAHKHVDDPSPEAVQAAIVQAVMSEICERFTFDGE